MTWKKKESKKLLKMGEEITQSDDLVPKNSAGIEETNKAVTPACAVETNLIDKCEGSTANCDGSVNQPQAEKVPKKAKTQDNSFEKSKKWYNISFMHRTGSTNASDTKQSVKDSRHSWHLNDSVEMWV